MAITITDLTDTTWILNDTLISYAGGTYSLKNYNINITTYTTITDVTGSNPKTDFTLFTVGYSNGSENNCIDLDFNNYPFYSFASGHDTKTLPDTWNTYYNKPFTITGGTDATNATLIAWFEVNAEQQMAPDVVIEYEGTEIATMRDSGTKTLKTGGKYMTDDVTIQYTKQGSSTVQSDWDETDITSAAYILNKPNVAKIGGIAEGVIGKETTYNTNYINWEDSTGDVVNFSIDPSTSTVAINQYDAANDDWSTLGSIVISNEKARIDGVIAANTDLDSVTEVGFWNCANSTTCNTLTNCPVTGTGFTMLVAATSPTGTNRIQTLLVQETVYIRFKTSSGWTTWAHCYSTKEKPAVSELKGSERQYLSSSGTATFTLTSAKSYLLVVSRFNNSTANNSGLYIIQCHTTSSVRAIASSGVATVSVSGTTLTVTTSSSNVDMELIRLTP